MAGWGKLVAGVVLGVAGTVYATNEELRERLPGAAKDLPETVRQRYRDAVSAAREASSKRRKEILRDLEEHDVKDYATHGGSADGRDGGSAEQSPDVSAGIPADEDVPRTG